MKAMVLSQTVLLDRDQNPLRLENRPDPEPGPGEILVKVSACGVCHTEIDIIEGRTPPPRFPVIPGHQVVGRVAAKGPGVTSFQTGERVGVGWIYHACGHCRFCRPDEVGQAGGPVQDGRENLCPDFRATGRDADGGYAEYMKVAADFAHPIPDGYSDGEAAPLLCAGGVGYRSLRLCGLTDGQSLGLTGFGASGHLVLKLAKGLYPQTRVYVFARNREQREFAVALGADWAGETEREAPEKLRAIIDTTPAWQPVIAALANLEPGGRLIINAIRKEDKDRDCLGTLDYQRHLWQEKEIKSVANVTRTDIAAFLAAAARIDLRPVIETYSLEEANRALVDLKKGGGFGAKVLIVQ